MNTRLKSVRKALGLSQIDFAQRIGVTDGAISSLERGQNNLTDQMILAICRAYLVNETWFRTGVGEMFDSPASTSGRELLEHLNLSAPESEVIDTYMSMSPPQKMVVNAVVNLLADDRSSRDDT